MQMILMLVGDKNHINASQLILRDGKRAGVGQYQRVVPRAGSYKEAAMPDFLYQHSCILTGSFGSAKRAVRVAIKYWVLHRRLGLDLRCKLHIMKISRK